jgi:hypothetical protein
MFVTVQPRRGPEGPLDRNALNVRFGPKADVPPMHQEVLSLIFS